MIYDVHAHCIPESFRDWLARSGPSAGAAIVEGPRGQGVEFSGRVTTGPQFGLSALTNREQRLEQMDRMGIDVQVLAGWIDLSGYELEREGAAEYSKAHNDALAAEASQTAGRFRALGTAPLQFPDLAVEVLDHAINELGMQGMQIATTVDGQLLDQVDGLDYFWQAAQDLGAFIVLHPMRPLAGLDLSRYFMDNAVGRPAESSVALAGLIFSGVFERFPGLRVCVVHGAGFIPYQIGRLDKAFHQHADVAGSRISRPPSEYLRLLYADTIVHDPLALAFLVATMGADRVLLGTDYPFPMGDQDPVGLVQSTPGLGQGDVDAIIGANAQSIFG
ncbi:MAG: amidohydrolase [Actinomycetota bacterium]|nr:amidohydrolase [Actinomycetota bacterium]